MCTPQKEIKIQESFFTATTIMENTKIQHYLQLKGNTIFLKSPGGKNFLYCFEYLLSFGIMMFQKDHIKTTTSGECCLLNAS